MMRTKDWLLLTALAVAWLLCSPGCRRTSGEKVTGGFGGVRNVPQPDGLLMVGHLYVRDVSAAGNRIPGLRAAMKASLLDTKAHPHVQTRPKLEHSLSIRIANVCERDRCYLAAGAVLSIPGVDGLSRRTNITRRSPIEGIAFGPSLALLRPKLLHPLRLWAEAISAPPARLRSWLSDPDPDREQAALHSILARSQVDLAPDLAPLIRGRSGTGHPDQGDRLDPDTAEIRSELQMEAIAVAGAFQATVLVPDVLAIAKGEDLDLARAAVGALADIGSPPAMKALEQLSSTATLQTVRALSRAALGSDKKSIR